MVDKIETIITLEDVMRFNDDEWIEVVDGELVKTDTIRIYKNDDTLEAETLFPGLKIKISSLFVIEDD
jgi:hypothetical protein